jgi:hypothetical protein
MMVKIARVYVVVLFLVDLTLLATSLLLHVSVWLGARQLYARLGLTVLVAALVVNFVVLFLAKERNVWKNEFKACPRWVQGMAIAFGSYGFGVAIFQTVLLPNAGGPDDPFTVSAIPLAFEALSLTVLYSVLWAGSLPQAELPRKTATSFIAAVIALAILVANHAGYLSHPVR